MSTEKTYKLADDSMEILTRVLREMSANDLEGMKEACWENVHEGVAWRPMAEGFIMRIEAQLTLHDWITVQRAGQEYGERQAITLDKLDESKSMRKYMKTILDELKKAAPERKRPVLRVLKPENQ